MINPKYERKDTERARWKLETADKLFELAASDTQKFYLKRTVKYERYLQKLGYNVNPPTEFETTKKHIKATYNKKNLNGTVGKYIEIFKPKKNLKNNKYGKLSSLAVLLKSWPKSMRTLITCLPEYTAYKKALMKHNFDKYVFEHGDYNKNNLLITSNGRCLVTDFEFSRPFQPTGFDHYDFHKFPMFNDNYYLNRKKYKLTEKINQILDNNEIVKIQINQDNLMYLCRLYKEIQANDKRNNYNLNTKWIINWIRFFKPKRLRVNVLLKNGKATAMLFTHDVWTIRNGYITRPIGQAPDSEDVFCVASLNRLSESELLIKLLKDKKKFFCTNFLLTKDDPEELHNLMNFHPRLIDYIVESETELPLKDKKKREKLRQLKNKLNREFNLSTADIEYTEDSTEFDYFINLWLQRWNFDKIDKKSYIEFLRRNLSHNMTLLVLRTKNTKEIIAFHLCYIQNDQLVSHIPVINPKYKDVSPMKILIEYHLADKKYRGFNFGRGLHTYKLWFGAKLSPIYEIRNF